MLLLDDDLVEKKGDRLGRLIDEIGNSEWLIKKTWLDSYAYYLI